MIQSVVQFFVEFLCNWLHRKCTHPPKEVVADLLEGEGNRSILWCRVCGAYRFEYRDKEDVVGYWNLAVSPWRKGAVTQKCELAPKYGGVSPWRRGTF